MEALSRDWSRTGLGALLVVTLLAATLAGVPISGAQEPDDTEQTHGDSEHFGEQIDVTLVEVAIDPRDRKGNPVFDLRSDELEVWEDGQPVEIVGLDYPASLPQRRPLGPDGEGVAAASGSQPQPVVSPRTAEWRYVVYVDGAVTSPRSLRKALGALADRVDSLVASGPVEVVLADPSPRIVQPFTRDPDILRRGLAVAGESRVQHQLLADRRAFLRFLDNRWENDGVGPLLSMIRASVQREHALINQRVRVLSEWMTAYGDLPASAALIISGGFDLDPSGFYLSAPAVNLSPQLQMDLQEYRLEQPVDRLSRQLAATGWTTVFLSIGSSSVAPVGSDASLAQRDKYRSIGGLGSNPGQANVNSIVAYPMEPLAMVAEATGGEIVTTTKRVEVALEALEARPRLTYRAPRSRDGEVHQLRVETTRQGTRLNATRWVRSPTPSQVRASRATRLLVADAGSGQLPVELNLDLLADTKETQSLQAQVRYDLSALVLVLDPSEARLWLTFAVEIPKGRPFVQEVEHLLDLPNPAEDTLPTTAFTTRIEVPKGTKTVSVVVEEPETGIWGGAVSQIDFSP